MRLCFAIDYPLVCCSATWIAPIWVESSQRTTSRNLIRRLHVTEWCRRTTSFGYFCQIKPRQWVCTWLALQLPIEIHRKAKTPKKKKQHIHCSAAWVSDIPNQYCGLSHSYKFDVTLHLKFCLQHGESASLIPFGSYYIHFVNVICWTSRLQYGRWQQVRLFQMANPFLKQPLIMAGYLSLWSAITMWHWRMPFH